MTDTTLPPAVTEAPRTRFTPGRIALGVLVVLLALGFGVDRVTRASLIEHQKGTVKERLDPYVNALSTGLRRRYQYLLVLQAFVDSAKTRAQVDREFPAKAAAFTESLYGVRSVQLVRDGVIESVYPLEGNEKALGYKLESDPRPELGADARRALSTGLFTVTGPLPLVEGGRGLVARLKIDRKRPGFPDLVSVIIDPDSLFQGASMLHGIKGLAVGVLDKSGNLVGPRGGSVPADPVSLRVIAPDGDWRLVAAPVDGWDETVSTLLFAFRSAWFVISVLLAGVAYLMATHESRLAIAVRLRTRELEQANIELQREVHERKEAEAALRRHEERLVHSQKMEAVGTLAGGIAHDFNNVLTAIIGFGGLALNRARDLEAADATGNRELSGLRQDIEELLRATEHAVLVTNQLLAFSRKQVVQPESIDAAKVIRDVEGMLQRVIGERVRLETRLAPDLPRVYMDAGQLTQVLVNLAVNARDAMPRGGRLTIEASSVAVTPGSSRAERGVPDGEYVEIAVSDTGQGMTPDVLARMFEPFFTTKGLGKGTGLGLSTVYGIILRMGGRVLVASEPGKGSTFRLLLPESPSSEVPARAVAAPAAVSRSSETVLLVEDEPSVRHLAVRVLSSLGFTVLEAASGEDALTITRGHSEPIDLLLTDLVMPGINGRELSERVRELRPGIRVLFMSGYSDEASAPGAGAGGEPVNLLPKPFTPDSLAARVREVLKA